MLTRAVRTLRLDLEIALRQLLLNRLAGSALLPRPLRTVVYRLAGLDVRTMNVFAHTRITGRNLRIGRGTAINHECYLDVAKGRIDIGANCHLGPQVMVLTATHDLGPTGAHRKGRYTTTTIGDNVWLGARTTVLPGVTIGKGCVVAAGAVVSSDCLPGGVYGGVPAKRIRDV